MGQILKTYFKSFIFFLFCISAYSLNAQGTQYVSFPMINQEIRHSLEEHSRQKKMHRNQLKNTTSENINKTQWSKYKEIKEKVQKRLSIVSFALQAIPTGYKLTQDAKRIKVLQLALYNELKDAPYLLKDVFQSQLTFIDELQMTIRFIIGIVSTYGTINQMEKAERQTLLNYALDETKRLKTECYTMLLTVKNIKEKLKLERAKIQYGIDRDKNLVKDILKNIKNF